MANVFNKVTKKLMVGCLFPGRKNTEEDKKPDDVTKSSEFEFVDKIRLEQAAHDIENSSGYNQPFFLLLNYSDHLMTWLSGFMVFWPLDILIV
jgi:hypothetical protein